MFVSIETAVGVDDDVGSNVTSLPPESTAVHWVAVGHATAVSNCPSPIDTDADEPGDAGLNVTSSPALPTAVHCPVDGQATLARSLPTCPTATGLDAAGELGLNVISSRPPTTMHSVVAGHAMLDSAEPRWIVVGDG